MTIRQPLTTLATKTIVVLWNVVMLSKEPPDDFHVPILSCDEAFVKRPFCCAARNRRSACSRYLLTETNLASGGEGVKPLFQDFLVRVVVGNGGVHEANADQATTLVHEDQDAAGGLDDALGHASKDTRSVAVVNPYPHFRS